MTTGNDSASLNFEGDFAQGAEKFASSAERLADSLARLAQESAKVKSPKLAAPERAEEVTKELQQQIALEAKFATFDTDRVRRISDLQAQYKKLHDDASGATAKEVAKQQERDAKEAAKEQARAAKEAAKEQARIAREQDREAKEAAKEAAREAKEADKERTRETKEAAKEKQRAEKEAIKEKQRAEKEAAREAKEEAREEARNAKKAARDEAKRAREEARDAKKAAKEAEEAYANGPAQNFTKGLLGGAEVLTTASGLAFKAGEIIRQGAVELAHAAFALTKAGVELSIAETSKKELQSAIFKQLGNAGGYDVAIKLAATYGIDEGVAIDEVKGLLNAKFSSTEIPVVVRIATALDAVNGKGGEFVKKLEEIKLKPKVDAEAIKSLAAVGIDTKEVYANLAKQLGTTVPQAEAKVKAGLVSTKDVLAAIEKTGDKAFGGLAAAMADTVPALAGHVVSQLKHLFDSVDLGPIKEFLKNVSAVLDGPAGGELKAAITDLFGALNHAFLDQFKGEEGKAKIAGFFHSVAATIHEAAETVKELEPLIDLVTRLGLVAADGAPAMFDFLANISGLKDAAEQAQEILQLVDAIEELISTGEAGGASIGDGIVQGLIGGLDGGLGAAIAAAVSLVTGALDAAKAAIGQHSPSTAWAEVGHFSAEGYAKGANDNASPVAAGEAIVGKSLAAGKAVAQGGAGGVEAGGAGAGGGGHTFVFAPAVHPPSGSGPEVAAAVKAVLAEEYPRFEAMVRRSLRERAA